LRTTTSGDRDSSDLSIVPVQKTRAYEEVIHQFEDLIRREALRPGDRLPPERELALRFKVSRVTIRQALTVLQTMGLIERRVGDGTFARGERDLTVTTLASALRLTGGGLVAQLELRRLLEPQVARLAAERAAGADLEAIGDHIAAQERRHAAGAPFVAEDGEFHLAIARATKNELLVRMVNSIHELLRDTRERSLTTPAGRERSLRWHHRIARAIAEGQGQAAYDAMLGHLLDVESLVLASGAAEPGGSR
jgi:GntR family transcriptional regulator, transcriptional repressor for pyruvate dehydrogenase complex